MKLPGVINPNEILSGRFAARTGDTFIAESDDNCGFIALRFVPLVFAEKPHEHFEVLARGTRETCEAAAV